MSYFCFPLTALWNPVLQQWNILAVNAANRLGLPWVIENIENKLDQKVLANDTVASNKSSSFVKSEYGKENRLNSSINECFLGDGFNHYSKIFQIPYPLIVKKRLNLIIDKSNKTQLTIPNFYLPSEVSNVFQFYKYFTSLVDLHDNKSVFYMHTDVVYNRLVIRLHSASPNGISFRNIAGHFQLMKDEYSFECFMKVLGSKRTILDIKVENPNKIEGIGLMKLRFFNKQCFDIINNLKMAATIDDDLLHKTISFVDSNSKKISEIISDDKHDQHDKLMKECCKKTNSHKSEIISHGQTFPSEPGGGRSKIIILRKVKFSQIEPKDPVFFEKILLKSFYEDSNIMVKEIDSKIYFKINDYLVSSEQICFD